MCTHRPQGGGGGGGLTGQRGLWRSSRCGTNTSARSSTALQNSGICQLALQGLISWVDLVRALLLQGLGNQTQCPACSRTPDDCTCSAAPPLAAGWAGALAHGGCRSGGRFRGNKIVGDHIVIKENNTKQTETQSQPSNCWF